MLWPLAMMSPILALEEAEREIFLAPRNFNPHPYVASYEPGDPTRRVGPVLFPPSPENEDDTVRSNVVAGGRDLGHPVDHHPYPKLAKKNRHKFPGRYDQDNRINPGVYEGLSRHAAKVLSEPPSQLGQDYTLSSLSNQRKNYAFSYKVVDHLTGDDFSHTQSQNSRATNGEYRVKLPDGRVQIVSYIADKNGYKADVKYTENEPSSPNVQILPKLRPNNIPTSNSYDYQYEDEAPHLSAAYDGGEALLYTPPPTASSTVAPDAYSPTYPKGLSHYATPRPNVQIYVGSTAAPYYDDDDAHYNTVSSTLAPRLQDYNQVYITTPKYHQNQQYQLVYGK